MGNHRDTKWDKGSFYKKKRISDEDKKAIFWDYQAALKTDKASDDILNELSQRYDRSPRQIQRYIEQVAEEIARKQTGGSLDQTVLSKARDEHFAEIRSFIEHWKGIIEERNSPFRVVWPPYYGLEQDKLFPYVLDHCPSIKDKYEVLGVKRDGYKGLEKIALNQVKQLEEACAEAERQLKDAIEMSLLSREYIRHKCDLCP